MLTKNALGTIHRIGRTKNFSMNTWQRIVDLVEHTKYSFEDHCIQVCRSIHQEIGMNSLLVEDDWPLYSFDCSTQQYFFNDQHRNFYFRLSCSLLSGRFSKLIRFPLNCVGVSSLTFWSGNDHLEGFHDCYRNLEVSEWSNYTLSTCEWIRQAYTGSPNSGTKQRVMSQFSV